jgi:hypothetical protein
MYMITTIKNTLSKQVLFVLGVFGLTLATIVTLFAYEGATPLRFATDEALAWHCESITATPSTVHAGEPVTIEWSFAADSGITVTIDQLPGEVFSGTSGSVVVYPTETTKYRAVAHKDGVQTTFDCCTEVTVLPPVDPCKDVDLHIDDEYSFTFTGPPALSHYEVTYCDGTKSGKVEDTWNDVETITLTKEIKKVSTKAGQCEKEQSRTCTPPENPKVPMCPFNSTDTVTVINLNGGKERNAATVIRSDQSEARSFITEPITLEAGTYTVYTSSWDGYPSRINVTQPNEKWNVEVLDTTNTVLGMVGSTTDIKDKVVEDQKDDTFTNALTLATDANKFSVVHAVYPDKSSANSVVPICVAFEKKPETPGPACQLDANPNEIDEGGFSTITWSSQNVSSVDITNIGTGLPVASSTIVSPATTTTYVGTFYGNDGTTKICEDTVTIRPPEPEPFCELFANPTTIEEGNTSILSWDSEYVNSVDITNIGTGLPVASSTIVSPATTTTYVGTFYADKETLTCEATITVVPPQVDPDPTCAMSISPSRVSRGGTATLTWTSTEIVSASIDQGIGNVAVNDSTNVTVNSNTTYTGTFIDDTQNTITCAASVSIKGGGGKCTNCGGDDDDDPEPSIVLGKTITKAGSFITLNQVPYTGFKAGPLLTTVFWLSVLLISVGIAYILTRYKPFARLQLAFSGESTAQTNIQIPVQRSVLSEVNELQTLNTDYSSTAYGDSPQRDQVSEIEEIAHSENILLSPEALRLIKKEVAEDELDTTAYLAELFAQVKSEFPREDGWILLSKERIESLINPSKETEEITPVATIEEDEIDERPFRVEKKQISVSDVGTRQNDVKPAQTQASTQTTSSTTNNVVSKFVDHLIGVQKKEAFDLLRNISTRGVDISTFMTLVVRQLDEVYKHRIEGTHNPTSEILQKTAQWSTDDFEVVLGILVECIDYSYSNNRIGTKIALAKAFEHFEKK